MKRRVFSVLAVVALLSGLLVGALPAGAAPPPPDYEPIDVGPKIREWPATADMIAPPDEAIAQSRSLAGPAVASVGDVGVFLILNDYLGAYQATYFTLRAEGEHAQIWVQNNLGWPVGDPRPTPVVTDDQLYYLLDQFENHILPQETAFFGAPDALDGSQALLPGMLGLPDDAYYDEAGRTIILVSNVRDDNYYVGAPTYIAGFYSPSFEVYLDRNVITIDAYDWANRIGPDGSRPYLYEGTIAHEYQHLLHDDVDSDEETWVNEGCADFAEFLCGYGHPDSHVEQARLLPENSLVLWNDQGGGYENLSDYGHAYLWTLYLNDKFGSSLIQAVFNNPGNGIEGVDAALQGAGINRTFAELYSDWAVALLIDSQTPGGGRYQFDSIDFGIDMGTPEAPNPEAFGTPGAPPWGTDYMWISGNPKDLLKLKFNGLDYSLFPTAWTSDGEVLWSGAGDEIEHWAIFEATGGGVLTFDTMYDIEDYWDFGFVQVSTDGGHNWTSLANEYTTDEYDPNAYPTVKANVPGLTGLQDEWMTMSFDLGAYAGQDILVAFRYVTDWATAYEGWYIDNVYVDDTLISDGSSTDVFHDLTHYVPIDNNFIVTFVGFKGKGQGNEYKVVTLKLSDVTEDGLFELNKVLKTSDKAAMLVTFAAPQGFRQYAEYTYEFGFKSNGKKK